jgi:hypothetical protein
VTFDGPYLPLWQIQPTISDFDSHNNWYLMSIPEIPGQEAAIQAPKPVLFVPYLLADTSNPYFYEI